MRSLFQEWLASEFGVAEAEEEFRIQLLRYFGGDRIRPPDVAELLRSRIARCEARQSLARVIGTARHF